jgi:hypothetical protein
VGESASLVITIISQRSLIPIAIIPLPSLGMLFVLVRVIVVVCWRKDWLITGWLMHGQEIVSSTSALKAKRPQSFVFQFRLFVSLSQHFACRNWQIILYSVGELCNVYILALKLRKALRVSFEFGAEIVSFAFSWRTVEWCRPVGRDWRLACYPVGNRPTSSR